MKVIDFLKKKMNIKNVSFELIKIQIKKLVRQRILNRKTQVILGIMGCQRSGTSLINRIFFRDIDSKIYREGSRLSSRDIKKLRLDPLSTVRRKIRKNKAPLVVLKPLVESQNALKFLRYFPVSKVLWMYREYHDVAASNLKAFGEANGYRDLQAFIEESKKNWRSENSTTFTKAIIKENYLKGISPHDAAALFWFARNQLFYDQELDKNPRVFLCAYEDLVRKPVAVMERIYAFIGMKYPGNHIISEVNSHSIKKGKAVRLSPSVEKICKNLSDKLDSTYQRHRS